MAADRVELPQRALLDRGCILARQQPVDQTGDQIRAERKAGGELALTLMFVPRALQERRVAQDIGRRLDLTEELLRREQIASFRLELPGVGC
jgi:hypothetical protein